MGRPHVDGHGEPVVAQQLAERDGAQTDAALLEKPAARHSLCIYVHIEVILTIHGLFPESYSLVIVSSRLSKTRETTVQPAS